MPHASGRHEVDAQCFFYQMISRARLCLGRHGGLPSWMEVLILGNLAHGMCTEPMIPKWTVKVKGLSTYSALGWRGRDVV